MKIGIVDYGAGNLGSLKSALRQIDRDFKDVKVQNDIRGCSSIIIPGVGSFGTGITNLESRNMIPKIQEFAKSGKRIIGICLGMHLLASFGNEGGEFHGLDLIEGSVEKLQTRKNYRVPHLGWDLIHDSNLNSDFAYFAHSYYFKLLEKSTTQVYSHYDWENQKLPATISKDNIVGFQFHPEKSGNFGLKLLNHYLA